MVVVKVTFDACGFAVGNEPVVLKSDSMKKIAEYIDRTAKGRGCKIKVYHGEEAEKFEKYAFEV